MGHFEKQIIGKICDVNVTVRANRNFGDGLFSGKVADNVVHCRIGAPLPIDCAGKNYHDKDGN